MTSLKEEQGLGKAREWGEEWDWGGESSRRGGHCQTEYLLWPEPWSCGITVWVMAPEEALCQPPHYVSEGSLQTRAPTLWQERCRLGHDTSLSPSKVVCVVNPPLWQHKTFVASERKSGILDLPLRALCNERFNCTNYNHHTLWTVSMMHFVRFMSCFSQ